jgi:hypothetical protein
MEVRRSASYTHKTAPQALHDLATAIQAALQAMINAQEA